MRDADLLDAAVLLVKVLSSIVDILAVAVFLVHPARFGVHLELDVVPACTVGVIVLDSDDARAAALWVVESCLNSILVVLYV